MAKENPLDALVRRLTEALDTFIPENARREWDARARQALGGILERFQLVPREDFEAELAELERLRKRVADLEARIDELERDRAV